MPSDPTDPVRKESGAAGPELDLVERRVLEVCFRIGAFIEYWGFKAIQGRVWAYLVLSATPRSQQEVARVLGVSKALVSTTISELEARGLVTARGQSRTAPYTASTDVWPVIADVLRSREWMLLERARLSLESAREEMGLAGPGSFDPARVDFLLGLTRLGQAVLAGLVTVRTSVGPGVGRALREAARFLTRPSHPP